MDKERTWIKAALSGDQQAFAHLIEAYQVQVYNLAYRMLGNPQDAEDAAQEAFLRAYSRLRSYDQERPFGKWLLAIAAHHCIDRLRRRRLPSVSLDDLPPWRWLAVDTPGPEEVVLRRDASEQIQQLLNQLPADYRLAIVLRYWYDLSYREIAEVTESTESAVKSRLHRARRMLVEAVGEQRSRTEGAQGVDSRNSRQGQPSEAPTKALGGPSPRQVMRLNFAGAPPGPVLRPTLWRRDGEIRR